MRVSRLAMLVAALAAVALLPQPTFAQGTPSGTISGQVTDPEGLPLPGVVVTVESPSLQGKRSAVASMHGDYIIPFLAIGH